MSNKEFLIWSWLNVLVAISSMVRDLRIDGMASSASWWCLAGSLVVAVFFTIVSIREKRKQAR